MKKTLWRLSAVMLFLGAAMAAFSVGAFTAEPVEKANEQLPAQAAYRKHLPGRNTILIPIGNSNSAQATIMAQLSMTPLGKA